MTKRKRTGQGNKKVESSVEQKLQNLAHNVDNCSATPPTVQKSEKLNVAGIVNGVPMVLSILGVFGIVAVGGYYSTKASSLLEHVPPPVVEEVEVDYRAVVIEQVKATAEIITAVHTLQVVVPTEASRTYAGIWQTKSTLLYIAKGEVRAGVDLAGLSEANVVELADGTIEVTLPPAKILNSNLDLEESGTHSYEQGVLAPDAEGQLTETAQDEGLKQIVNGACEGEILQQATDQAVIVVQNILNLAEVNVVVKPGEVGSCAK